METVCSWGCPLELLLRGAFRHLAVSRAIRANERLKGAQRAMIGIIGGTGLYAMQELQTPRAHTVSTPFGAPSAPLMTGMLRGREVVFLARHGLEHQLLPGEINFRANIWALKNLGVRTVIGVDPATNIVRTINDPRIIVVNDFFTSAVAGRIRGERGHADLVVANNVYAHLPEISDVTHGVAELLADEEHVASLRK